MFAPARREKKTIPRPSDVTGGLLLFVVQWIIPSLSSNSKWYLIVCLFLSNPELTASLKLPAPWSPANLSAVIRLLLEKAGLERLVRMKISNDYPSYLPLLLRGSALSWIFGLTPFLCSFLVIVYYGAPALSREFGYFCSYIFYKLAHRPL